MMGLRRSRLGIACLILLGGMVACGGDAPSLVGVVTAVDGDLTRVDSFQVRSLDGEVTEFTPAPGLSFHGSTPLSHLTDHVISGEPVEVTYEILDDGTRVATGVTDAGG